MDGGRILQLLLDSEKCSICKEPIPSNWKGFIDSCTHCYCLHCILKWANVKLSCPLCRKSFSYIKHNVMYFRNRELNDAGLKSILSRPTMRCILPGMNSPVTHRTYDLNKLRHRSEIYLNELTPFNPEINTGVTNISSAAYYRENQEAYRRMSNWVTREFAGLNLSLNFENNGNLTSSLVLSLLKQHDIPSKEFINSLKPHLGVYTEVFINELFHFAVSKLDIDDYDSKAKYVLPISVQIILAEITDDTYNSVIENLRKHFSTTTKITSSKQAGATLNSSILDPANPVPVNVASITVGNARVFLFRYNYDEAYTKFPLPTLQVDGKYEPQVDGDDGPVNKGPRLSKGTDGDSTVGGGSSSSTGV